MKIRYKQLFTIGMRAAYYTDNKQHDDFVITPTRMCERQMSRFRIRSRKTFDGIGLHYECSPTTNDATPFKPITIEEKFTFRVSVTNPDFWYFADVRAWENDKIFLLQNAVYNTTGNISVLNGPMINPVLYRPKTFKFETTIEAVGGLIRVLDSAGNILQTIIVRAKTATEPVGTKESFLINLAGYEDGSYTIRHINSGGNNDTQVYCSLEYAPGTLAIIEIKYRTGVAYTGIDPIQKYTIDISSRLTDWFIDVHIRPRTVPPFLASELQIKHLPVPPAGAKIFNRIVTNDANGYAQFKLTGQLPFSQKPVHLQLLKAPSQLVMDPLPLPSSITVQKDALNNLFTKIIVNV